MSKRLSIITIVLNDIEGIKLTIDSVLAQSYTGFEYIVIDGASNDGTTEEIRKYTNRIDTFISEKDNGIYDAFNKAIRIATGDYCLFLNSGDYLADGKVIETMMQCADGDSIIYGDMYIKENSGKLRLGKMPDQITFNHMIADTLWHPVSFIPKKLFDRFGYYDENLRMVADYEFFLRTIIVNKIPAKHISLPVSVFNLKGFSSDPKNIQLQKTERRMAQEKYFSSEEINAAEKYNRRNRPLIRRIVSLFR
jgi:glycosyltransferase involved in cell wall biosynthesis